MILTENETLILDVYKGLTLTKLKRVDAENEAIDITAYRMGEKQIRIDIKYK